MDLNLEVFQVGTIDKYVCISHKSIYMLSDEEGDPNRGVLRCGSLAENQVQVKMLRMIKGNDVDVEKITSMLDGKSTETIFTVLRLMTELADMRQALENKEENDAFNDNLSDMMSKFNISSLGNDSKEDN